MWGSCFWFCTPAWPRLSAVSPPLWWFYRIYFFYMVLWWCYRILSVSFMVLWWFYRILFPTSLCGVLVFGSALPPGPASPPSLRLYDDFIGYYLCFSWFYDDFIGYYLFLSWFYDDFIGYYSPHLCVGFLFLVLHSRLAPPLRRLSAFIMIL